PLPGIVEEPALAPAMAEEERVLDGARGGAQAARVAAERLQVVDPLAHREAPAGGIGGHPPPAGPQLPRADVQHAIAPRIEKGEDGGGHGHAHAVQGEEMLDAPALAPRGQGKTRGLADARGSVAEIVLLGPRALPAAHGEKLGARDEA